MLNEDFYVSLPSNVSLQEFPNNKQSNYTTLLAEPLEIPLNFQVALVEISNFSNFKIKLGKINFKNPLFGHMYEKRTPSLTFDITIENGISLEQFCATLHLK